MDDDDTFIENEFDGDSPGGPPNGPLGRPSQPYSAEHYNYLGSLYSTDYQQYLIYQIGQTHLSPKAKKAFVSTILNFFSPTAFLSYQKDTEIAEIDLDIALNILTVSCNTVDINLPEYPHIIELIRSHYNRFIISRTTGAERERILQNRTTYEQVSKIASEEEKKRKKRGLGIVGRLFGGDS